MFQGNTSQALEQEFDFRLPLEIKIINTAPVVFSFQVVRGKLLFFRDEELLTDFLEVTARKYLDIAPLRRHYLRAVLA